MNYGTPLRAFAAITVMFLSIAFAATGRTQTHSIRIENVPVPAKAPVIPETPEKRPDLLRNNSKSDEKAANWNGRWETEDLPENIEAPPRSIGQVIQPPLPKKGLSHGSRTSTGKHKIAALPILPESWSDREILKAKAQCNNLLPKAIFDFKPLDPIRKGVCGTPAPVLLNAVSADQTVTIRPAAKLNCRMAEQFHRWIVEMVQPSAKTHLNTAITGVINIASYHCRTRYGDPTQRMSQHAFANALDLAGFITAEGEQIPVEKFWNGDTPQSRFLRDIHAGACKIFGTVLGPNANNAHKDHFHLDLTKRRHGSYCQ